MKKNQILYFLILYFSFVSCKKEEEDLSWNLKSSFTNNGDSSLVNIIFYYTMYYPEESNYLHTGFSSDTTKGLNKNSIIVKSFENVTEGCVLYRSFQIYRSVGPQTRGEKYDLPDKKIGREKSFNINWPQDSAKYFVGFIGS